MKATQSTYGDKLRDPRWQRKRLEIFDRDNWRCCACAASDKPLNIHHLDYAGEPWEVQDNWLETLCDECHKWREHWNAIFGRSAAYDTRELKALVANLKALPIRDRDQIWESVKAARMRHLEAERVAEKDAELRHTHYDKERRWERDPEEYLRLERNRWQCRVLIQQEG